jgi:hypothetical protein
MDNMAGCAVHQPKNHYFTLNRLRFKYCLIAFLAFFGAIAIYAFFRDHNFVLFQIFPKPFFLDMFYVPVRTDSILISMLLFNLPDGLWFLSGLLLIRAVWLANLKWRAIYGGIFALTALSMEILQLFESIPGTFDVLDIAVMAIFACVESTFFNLFVKRSVV